MVLKNFKRLSLVSTLAAVFALSSTLNAGDRNCNAPYTEHIVHYADEHNPENRIITINYKDMELLNLQDVPGVTNHHADPMGELDKTHYMMLVAKGSHFVTIWDVKNDSFVKKINLPFRPRSADAYNKTNNLVLLTSRDRPAAVLIDATKLKIVGRAGFNTMCNHEEAIPIRNFNKLYSNQENFDPNFKCLAPDFGGDQISGHPLWISSDKFVIVDRANRLVHLYKIKKAGDLWRTQLIQTLATNSSMHQMIAMDKNDPNNKIFFGMTEGNKQLGIIPMVYKYRLVGDRLKLVGVANFTKYNIAGMFGHNLYITPDKKYLYAPVAAHLVIGKEVKDYKEKLKLLNEYKKIKKRVKFSKKFKRFIKWKGDSYYQKIIDAQLKKEGKIFVINTRNMRIKNVIEAGYGAGHVAFSKQRGIAIVTNHLDHFVTAIDYKHNKFIKNINLDFDREGIFSLTQSHMQYVSSDGEYYYNFWSDGGRFFRINLDTLELDGSIYTGGVPIQGNFYEKINTSCDYPAPDVSDGYQEVFEDSPDLNDISNSGDNDARDISAIVGYLQSKLNSCDNLNIDDKHKRKLSKKIKKIIKKVYKRVRKDKDINEEKIKERVDNLFEKFIRKFGDDADENSCDEYTSNCDEDNSDNGNDDEDEDDDEDDD